MLLSRKRCTETGCPTANIGRPTMDRDVIFSRLLRCQTLLTRNTSAPREALDRRGAPDDRVAARLLCRIGQVDGYIHQYITKPLSHYKSSGLSDLAICKTLTADCGVGKTLRPGVHCSTVARSVLRLMI
jgi:hypothetical protein